MLLKIHVVPASGKTSVFKFLFSKDIYYSFHFASEFYWKQMLLCLLHQV